VFDEINPDVLHFHNPAYWLHAALIGKKYKKLFHLHGPFMPATMTWPHRLLATQIHRIVDAELCLTRGMRATVLGLGWGVPDRTWTVSKGCRDAIRILARLDERWHLVFFGDGPMRKYLVDVALLEGVGHRTHFAGMLDDMCPAYAAMDAFLFLSKLEPFGLVIAEAMACRVPVFGLAAEGEYQDALYPLVTPDNSIFVNRANPGDYNSPEPAPVLDDVARHITDYGNDPKSYRDMIDRAHQWIVKRFDGRVQSESMLEIYELVLGKPTDSLGKSRTS
jgi:glycosyltransferase involved in cell wall biosynthesis